MARGRAVKKAVSVQQVHETLEYLDSHLVIVKRTLEAIRARGVKGLGVTEARLLCKLTFASNNIVGARRLMLECDKLLSQGAFQRAAAEEVEAAEEHFAGIVCGVQEKKS